jgi:membrane protease subunit (stomatin/prohibitin family)
MTTEEKLAEAKAQYHALVTGTLARVIVDKNGERVEFTAANRQGLQNYIAELSKELGLLTPSVMPSNGPINFLF